MSQRITFCFFFLLFNVTLFGQSNPTFSQTVGDVRFDLQQVKAIGEELRFYFLITNTAEADKELTIRANQHRLWNGTGNEYTSERIKIAEDSKSGSSFNKRNYIKGIPIKACFVFKKNNVAELKMIKLLELKTSEGLIRIADIPVAYGVHQQKPDKNGIELEDELFFTITQVKIEDDKLRVYFLTENRGQQDIKLTFRGNNQRIVDNTGTEYISETVEFASAKKSGYSMQASNMVPNVPIKGYFEFPNAGNVSEILLFEMKTFGNNFRVRNLRLQ